MMFSTTTSRCCAKLHRSAWHAPALVTVACTLLASMTSVTASETQSAERKAAANSQADRPVIGIEHRGPIKVVFQVTGDDMKEGVGKGLFYLRKIYKGYLAAGIHPDQLDIHAVYHGDASDHMLSDEAWNRVRNETGGNPNSEILTELAKLGVSVELCDTRRVANGWAKSDVHPDVKLVSGAYHRIIDLQLRGYAYAKF
ncbi:DsrE family protein [Candidatus Laterigemmans baculatus]|uniref:DsrE family protein n=1 Tax=Candidatus Laterigemmans baculatus TaxID=2770505 RepID=UPI0013DA9E3A|nr:DsrE family protein [Candidatus Laterigemmans baculatus]